MKKFSLYFLFMFLLFGCTSETIKVDEIVEDLEYYPLEIGNSWVYVYDSIVYDASLGIVDTLSGFIKEELIDEIEENRYLILRSWKLNQSDIWINTDRWTVYIDDGRLIKIEENLPFIKLVFPLIPGKSWKGNSLFDESIVINVAGETLRPYLNWNYQIISNNETYSNEDISSEDVVLISHINETSLVDLRFSEEKYAPNIGLVEKITLILDCACFNVDPDIPWEQKAEKGFILKQKLIKFN